MDSTAHSSSAHTSHAGPLEYVLTYVFLIVMMILTVVISKFYLGPLNNIAAMTIALMKATAVVLCFMQVRHGTKLTWVWAALGFLWLSLLFGILGDYLTRFWLQATGWSG